MIEIPAPILISTWVLQWLESRNHIFAAQTVSAAIDKAHPVFEREVGGVPHDEFGKAVLLTKGAIKQESDGSYELSRPSGFKRC